MQLPMGVILFNLWYLPLQANLLRSMLLPQLRCHCYHHIHTLAERVPPEPQQLRGTSSRSGGRSVVRILLLYHHWL